MNLRFHRSLGIFPGLRLNLNKSGVSLTGGVRGAHVTIGTSGINTSMGVPGTGISLREKIPLSTPRPSVHKAVPAPAMRPSVHEPPPLLGTEPSSHEEIPSSMRPILQNKPRFWKVLLVQEGLRLILEKSKPEWERATKIGMDVSRFCDWLKHKLDQLEQDINRISHICDGVTDSFVPPDEAQKICAVLLELTAVVEDWIGWEEEVRGFVDHPLYGDVASCVSGSTKLLFDEIVKAKEDLDQQIRNPPDSHIIDLVFHFRLPDGCP